MKTTGYGQTDVGQSRDNNEDCFLINDSWGLYVVCDGVGGSDAGEVASHAATDALCEYLKSRRLELNEFREDGDLKAIQELVVEAVNHASLVVHNQSQLTGRMGTTMTLLLAIGDQAIIASAGDSRAYHCREQRAALLTQDHPLANEMLISGEYTREQVRNSPFNHYLTRSIGSDKQVEVDTLVVSLVAGDVFLLCTEGLTRYFQSEDALGKFMFHDPESIPAKLVSHANSCGGKDNVTAVVVHVESKRRPLPSSRLQKWFTRVAML